jgi:predicted flap endonuclease-1-like 5' DNA nuclease
MLGVATDTGLVPDPEAIVAGFEAELLALKTEMRQRLMETALKFNIPLAEVESQMKIEAEADAAVKAFSMPVLDVEASPSNGAEPSAGDDLTSIVGIGPSYAAQLRKAGIVTFDALAGSTPDDLAKMIDVPEWRRPDFQNWIDQAKLTNSLLA